MYQQAVEINWKVFVIMYR